MKQLKYRSFWKQQKPLKNVNYSRRASTSVNEKYCVTWQYGHARWRLRTSCRTCLNDNVEVNKLKQNNSVMWVRGAQQCFYVDKSTMIHLRHICQIMRMKHDSQHAYCILHPYDFLFCLFFFFFFKVILDLDECVGRHKIDISAALHGSWPELTLPFLDIFDGHEKDRLNRLNQKPRF